MFGSDVYLWIYDVKFQCPIVKYICGAKDTTNNKESDSCLLIILGVKFYIDLLIP